ncbi:MAG TPA: histidine phosphatase family protein [Usitatibacter sp.]|jgi:phosphohistidine phosphatase|nr:histidine phosphatase family protein [Usitatibacter sp.]
MELILWRHAEAEDKGHKSDLERDLTKHGRKQAERMAQWLKPRLPEKCRVIVSPSNRTLQTVEPLGVEFAVDDRVAPDVSSQSVLEAAGWPRAGGTVMVVGHQPTLGEVAAQLLGADGGVAMPKGAAWWFATKGEGRNAETVLVAVMKPDLARE